MIGNRVSRAWLGRVAGICMFVGVVLSASGGSLLWARESPDEGDTHLGQGADGDAYLPFVVRSLPLEEWPQCMEAQHNAREWHGLMNSEEECHYDHEHKDNPHLLDDVFGTQLYEWAGGSISYPWQTGDGHGENEHKHEAYGWIVMRDLPPSMSSSEAGTPAGPGFIKHLRIQGHFDLNVTGAPTRFHSSYIEVMVCYKAHPTDCGIARYGGHQDYGELRVDGNWIPLPDDPEAYDGVEPPAVPENDYDPLLEKREHTSETNRVAWLGRFHYLGGEEVPINYTGFNHRTMDAFGPVNPANLSEIILTDPAVYNNSTHGLDFFILRMRHHMAGANGRMNWSGYATRFGLDANPACTEVGLDCVPISLENVPAVRSVNIQPRLIKEYDVSPEGVSWIEYPN